MQTTTEIGYNSKVEGDVVVTRVDAALNWFLKNSLWPMPMGLACCAIELMASGASRFDISDSAPKSCASARGSRMS